MQAMLFFFLKSLELSQCGSQARSMGNLVLWDWPSTKVGQEIIYKYLLFYLFHEQFREALWETETSLRTTSSSSKLCIHFSSFSASLFIIPVLCDHLKKNYLHWNFFLRISFTVIHNWYLNKYYIRHIIWNIKVGTVCMWSKLFFSFMASVYCALLMKP